MERESFENEQIAEIMNKYFVNIKVDREERPDVDKIYMVFIIIGFEHNMFISLPFANTLLTSSPLLASPSLSFISTLSLCVFLCIDVCSGNYGWWWMADECLAHS
jgi:hypothetical protein